MQYQCKTCHKKMIKLRNWKIFNRFFYAQVDVDGEFPFYNLFNGEKGPLEGGNSIIENCQAEKNSGGFCALFCAVLLLLLKS